MDFLKNFNKYLIKVIKDSIITVGATKSGRDLPIYEIGVLLKIGGTGSYNSCWLHHLNTLNATANATLI